jgi:hypothetical protein
MQPMIKSISHAFNGSFDTQLGARARLRLSDTLNTAPNYSTLNVLKGIIPTAEGYQYVFEPKLYSQSQISNSASIGLDIDLSNKSYLTFSASSSLRHYYEETVQNNNLSDQLRIQGDFGYSRKQTDHTTWTVKYSVWQNDYENFETVRSHSATVGFSHKLTPTVKLDVDAGPAYTEKGSVSYVANATLSRQLERNSFSAGYSHRISDSTGLGGSSDSDQGTVSFSQRLGRNTSINFQASAFHQSLYDYWGVIGAASLAHQLGRYCVIQAGSSYNGYRDYNSKRFYISFGLKKTPQIPRINTN